MTITNVPTPGAPIRSDWPQSITNEVNNAVVHKAGDTMTGDLTVGAGNPGSGQIAAKLFTSGTLTAAKERADGSYHVTLYRGVAQAGSAGDGYVRFMNGPSGSSVQAGLISLIAGPGVSYGTGSDRRLKDEVGPIVDALERLEQLRPIRFTWKSDPAAGEFDGFIADEVDPLIPGAVVGEPDAVDDSGTILPQQLDPAKLVPLLVAAVQQLAGRIAELEAR